MGSTRAAGTCAHTNAVSSCKIYVHHLSLQRVLGVLRQCCTRFARAPKPYESIMTQDTCRWGLCKSPVSVFLLIAASTIQGPVTPITSLMRQATNIISSNPKLLDNRRWASIQTLIVWVWNFSVACALLHAALKVQSSGTQDAGHAGALQASSAHDSGWTHVFAKAARSSTKDSK
eukprot:1411162-Amphidinium_carterae.1